MGKQFARREGLRVQNRRIRSLSKIGRVSNNQARKCKLSCSRVMADHEESFSNNHLRQPLLWMSRQISQRARSKALTNYAPLRRIWSLPRTGQDSSKQARKRKLSYLGAMADHEESFSNGHIRHPLLWTSQRRSRKARSKTLTDLTPIRYLWKESLPIPASQIYPLHLQV